MSVFKKVLLSATLVALVTLGAAAAFAYRWAHTALELSPSTLDVTIKPHSSLRSVAVQLERGGVPVNTSLFVAMARVLGLSSALKSGNYEFSSGITPYEVLQKIARGDVNEYVVTIVEGWTFKRMRAELDASPALRHDSASMSDRELFALIQKSVGRAPASAADLDANATGVPANATGVTESENAADKSAADSVMSSSGPTTGKGASAVAAGTRVDALNGNGTRAARRPMAGASPSEPEGMFFPDTYMFDKGASDLNVYRRAYRLMQQRLEEAWKQRADGLPYATPYEALKMASIVEKETGKREDRPMVAAVFVNRLKIAMPLQTDPAVIYGMGESYVGHLHKRDLQTDTPYNTYMRAGLPPTPIALPGVASIEAALHPADTRALYFVSRGDGTSAFSDNLGDHNKAVDKYIRGQ